MRRFVAPFAAFTLVVSMPGMLSAAFAHGGSYRGPPGEIPPDTREPSDPPPPPQGGGPQSPGGDNPGGPATGGGSGSGPSTGGGTSGGPGTGGGGSGAGPSTGGGGGSGPSTGSPGRGGGAKAPGYGTWVFWWGNNKDEILQLKSAVRRGMNSGTITGGAFGKRDAKKAVTDEAIIHRIVPALRALLADGAQSYHIRSAAELGLARIGDITIVDQLKRLARSPNEHREVRESAALAFGLLQQDDDSTRSFLVDLVHDTTQTGSFARPFAAISLGLLHDRTAAPLLVEAAGRREAGPDVRPACLLAVGLTGEGIAVPDLVAMLRGNKTAAADAPLSETETSYVVGALGKIGAPDTDKPGDETSVLDAVLRIVEKDKSGGDFDVRRSAVIALGEITPQCQVKSQRRAVDALKAVVSGGGEEQEREFAIMSLARIGAAKNADTAMRRDLVALLAREMEKGRGQTPAFAAMALGLVGRAIVDDGGAAPEEEIRAPLRLKFKQGGDPHERGAYALASGLVRDPLAVDEMLKTLKDRGADKRVRGWCALGLGLVGSGGVETADAIRATLKEESDLDLRVQSAMAAGLIGYPGVIDDLVGVLREHESSNYELGSAALALGQIGDERAIDALLEIAVDKSAKWPDLTRALAVVALGQIGDRRDVPVLARVATDINYRAHVPAISELLTIL